MRWLEVWGLFVFGQRYLCVSRKRQCLLPSGHPIAIWVSRLVILAVQGQSQGRVALFKPHGKTSVASSSASTSHVCNSLGCGLDAFHVLVYLLGCLAKPGIRWPVIILEGIAPVSIPKRRPMWWGTDRKSLILDQSKQLTLPVSAWWTFSPRGSWY